MLIVDRTSKRIVAEQVMRADNPWQQARGLMFRPPLEKKQGMLFTFPGERRIAIHMWFVGFPIDVVFLDHERRIVEQVASLQPWRYYRTRHRAQYFLEAPKGTIKRYRLQPGKALEFL